MARAPVRRARRSDLPTDDPPWVRDTRPSNDPPPPIEPDWATEAALPVGRAPEPFEPDWARNDRENSAPPKQIDPPWAVEPTDGGEELRAALAETAPPDPPWARTIAAPRQPKPVDPPWVEDDRPNNDPPPPIEPDWARAETETDERQSADPPWVDVAPNNRPPVILRGPIDPPWVPDAVSEALEAEETAARAVFEPDWATDRAVRIRRGPLPPIEPSWADDGAQTQPEPTALFDPAWERNPSPGSRPPPVEPDWASERGPAQGDAAIELFDPDWEESDPLRTVVALPPIEPSWAVETRSEVEQARSDPFDAPVEEDTISPFDKTIVLKGARRLKHLASQVSLNPFGRAKRRSQARALDREKLIADAMRIRSETREALGEDTVNALYRGIMGTDPPAGENR